MKNCRPHGRQNAPDRILFETRDDLLGLLGKRDEFAVFAAAADRLRAEFPELAGPLRAEPRRLVAVAGEVDGLLHVLRCLRGHPRPNFFAREAPLPFDTKFIERHTATLGRWLDAVLPPHAIRADERNFFRRYGLRGIEPHVRLRLLDAALKSELSCPWPELSLPLPGLAALPGRAVRVFVVENLVNLLTFPEQGRGLVIEGRGSAVVELRNVRWLSDAPLTYWGDCDVEGFRILSSLRAVFPHVRSLLMDAGTLDRRRPLAVVGTGARPDVTPHLTAEERAALERCRDDNLRLEQERLPRELVLAALGQDVAP